MNGKPKRRSLTEIAMVDEGLELAVDLGRSGRDEGGRPRNLLVARLIKCAQADMGIDLTPAEVKLLVGYEGRQ